MAMRRKSVSYRIDAKLDERMNNYVAEHGGSKTALVERAVTKYLAEREYELARESFERSVKVLGAETVQLLLRDAVVNRHKSGG